MPAWSAGGRRESGRVLLWESFCGWSDISGQMIGLAVEKRAAKLQRMGVHNPLALCHRIPEAMAVAPGKVSTNWAVRFALMIRISEALFGVPVVVGLYVVT